MVTLYNTVLSGSSDHCHKWPPVMHDHLSLDQWLGWLKSQFVPSKCWQPETDKSESETSAAELTRVVSCELSVSWRVSIANKTCALLPLDWHCMTSISVSSTDVGLFSANLYIDSWFSHSFVLGHDNVTAVRLFIYSMPYYWAKNNWYLA